MSSTKVHTLTLDLNDIFNMNLNPDMLNNKVYNDMVFIYLSLSFNLNLTISVGLIMLIVFIELLYTNVYVFA